jgi:hypothetical protein
LGTAYCSLDGIPVLVLSLRDLLDIESLPGLRPGLFYVAATRL